MEVKKQKSYFTDVDRACVGCTEARKPRIVIRSTDNEEEVAVLLPLLEAEREGFRPSDPGYLIRG